MVILSEFVASSSSSSPTYDHKYDVFLSFRGVDTRFNFTNHLHRALVEANLSTFLDDEEIQTGEFLKPELENAIKASRASIIVLSQNYASSTWCLEELVLILEQKRDSNQIVIPIFYHVEPADVRKQQRSFGEAMEKHKHKMESESNVKEKGRLGEKIEIWKNALKQVSNLKGKDAKGRFESELIEEIVNDIHIRLGAPTTLPQFVGMERHVERITSWLTDGSSLTADILTIWGMGGIGKTYLANYAYELHRRDYTSSFVGDISRRCAGKYLGLLDIENALARKKVLLVLDDVDSLDQLDALLGNKGFHPGSKIIITTKDMSLIESYPSDGYEEVSRKLARYCDGHPLALEVLGKSLHKRDVPYWEECIKGLKKEPLSGIEKAKRALMMSFDSLSSDNDKEFFNIKWTNELMMHSMIQEMGRDLVRQESPNKPWERSRLWCHEESFKVLKQRKGTENILGITLDMKMLDKKNLRGSFELKTESFGLMDNLKLLQLNYVQLNGSFDKFPEELRWLCMHGFPLKSIPLDLPMENLVALDMSYSKIESFDMSKDKQLLGSLKILDLSFCEQLHSVGGFSELLALERLILRSCINLTDVCESVGQCVELVHIDLSYCCKLKKVPISIGKLKKVKTLLLDGCDFHESQIEPLSSDSKFFVISLPISLRMLSLANSNLGNESFPADFSRLGMLEELCLDNNPIVSMPSCVRSLPRLEKLSMIYCDKMISIEHPPRTLRELHIYSNIQNSKTLTRKIKFDPEMSPLNLLSQYRCVRTLVPRYSPSLGVFGQYNFDPEMSPLIFDKAWIIFPQSSLEIDGMVKIQPMESVEEKLLHSLGWINPEFTKEMLLETHDIHTGSDKSQTQLYYEFGIFSTIYEGEEMPSWIKCRSKVSSILFTIPSSPNNLRGLNFCCVDMVPPKLPYIKIINITTNHTWIYEPYIDFVSGDYCFSLLSHWMFGPNEMKAGDHIIITVEQGHYNHGLQAKECGISFVYDEDEKNDEEEDVLDYYKSWNYIIGRDLSPFQLTTGEYVLNNDGFLNYLSHNNKCYHRYFDYGAWYEEAGRVAFKKAFKAFFPKEV
ncbi:hypothetical protein SSX86_023160 [Deinandra increscens subsp. villosa]|uniref:TIR domain-containing protein n=1 Tax=Deinandra increscens subsp. villosa TaxID=3103831 RepID=A0AAP0GS16_9ASTR